jgi:hypothetical protein
MQSDVFGDVAVAVAAAAAAVAVGYARASSHAARDAVQAARRTVEVAEISRQAAERARIRHRIERVGELIQEIFISSAFDSEVDGLSLRTQGQCHALSQAVIGLKELLPKSTEVCLASSPAEVQRRATKARLEVDRVLVRMARSRADARYRRDSGGRTRRHRSAHRR